jgi:hypothetical protein
MSKPLKSIAILLFAASAGFAGAAMADDATLNQVYQAANSGHLAQAQEMMAQVLKDHPESGKAHYVEAELDYRGGQIAAAREQFATAERLAPGLPFAKPESVAELRAGLNPQQRVVQGYGGAPAPRYAYNGNGGGGFHFPWGLVIGVGLIVLIVSFFARRRQQVYMSNSYGGPGGGNYGGNYGGGYVGGGYPPPGGGGLLGSLGTGLAVGAGVVAGEELAHKLLDVNGRPVENYGQGYEQGYRNDPPVDPNPDMGGNDFGVSDSGSWDDSSSGDSGGGGSDWS